MKTVHLYINYLLLAVCVSFIMSCSDEEIVKGSYNIKEGIPVTVSLGFNVQRSEVVSRSAASPEQEQTINRYYVIAFNRFGNVSGRKYTTLESENKSGSGEINDFQMTTGSGQQLFVIGNPIALGESMINKLDAVSSLNDFKKIYATLQDEGTQSVERTTFLMFGQLKNTQGDSDIAVDKTGFVNVPSPAKVLLQRVDARISFTIKAANEDYPDMAFTPRYCNIYNVSRNTYLFPQANDYAEDHEEDVENNYGNVTSFLFDGGNNEDGYTIEFYLLENRLTYKAKITQEIKEQSYKDAESLYALREKREKTNEKPDGSKPGQTYVPGNFVFANDHSTYVQLRGTLTYTNEEGRQVIADVSYKIHLGNTGNDQTADWANNESLVNNYETKRNTWYKYNVTITGVETLRVEVNVTEGEENEQRPGAEGDVIVTGESMVNLDSHYGRSKFTLTRGAIKDGLSWAFSTPFQRGIKVFNRENYTTDGTENGPIASQTDLSNREVLKTDITLNDYKWVQFVINKECGEETYNYAKYPGWKAYDGGSEDTRKAPAFGGNGITPADKDHYSNIANVKMYDVNQLLNKLFLEANKESSSIFVGTGDDATVTITAFIDEYIYKYNPTEVYYEEPDAAEPGDPDLELWKKTVNGDNRMLHICKEGAKYSPDGNTSWAESVITFSQCPVYTFYDPNSDVTTAWGTEAIMETGPLPIIPNNESQYKSNLPPTGENGENITSPDNGRANTLKVFEDRNFKWSDILYLNENEVEDNNGYRNLQEAYNSIWFACLGRNRDLNGDNIVDDNEIRWYLASIDQLTDLWIGEQAVPNARLYTATASETNVPRIHIASSTYYDDSPEEPWIIWAEEGASRGKAGDWETEDEKQSRYYRCVRNLGLSLKEADEEYADYVQHEQDGVTYTPDFNTNYREKWIKVSRLEQNTLRPYEPNRLPKHNEQSDYNRPYTQFAILIEDDGGNAVYPFSSTGLWTNYYNNEANNYPCPNGYRLPNQRELMLMYTTYPTYFAANLQGGITTDWDYTCKTAFSMNGWGDYTELRYGFTFDIGGNPGNMRLIDSDFYVKARCVRDITNEEAARRTDFPATE